MVREWNLQELQLLEQRLRSRVQKLEPQATERLRSRSSLREATKELQEPKRQQ
jgi:hypothetical protein